MKRSLVLKLLANEISNKNTVHYSYNGIEHADEVLKLMEQLGLVKPTRRVTVTRRDIELMPYEDIIEVNGWDEE